MERELLFSITKKDLVVQTFKSGGKGGQHQNKTDSGVRINHPDSGATGEARDTRSQHQNRKLALERLVEHPKFKVWHSKRVYEIIRQKTMEEIIEEQLHPSNLKIEIRKDDRWITYEGE